MTAKELENRSFHDFLQIVSIENLTISENRKHTYIHMYGIPAGVKTVAVFFDSCQTVKSIVSLKTTKLTTFKIVF